MSSEKAEWTVDEVVRRGLDMAEWVSRSLRLHQGDWCYDRMYRPAGQQRRASRCDSEDDVKG